MKIEEAVEVRGYTGHIAGSCAPQFLPVLAAFRSNFEMRREIGGAVTIFQEGERVVDLWGGFADLEQQKTWQANTVSVLFSLAKGMGALCIHILADRGKIDLDTPVSLYWPEFLDGGSEKSGILVRHILSHCCGMVFNDHSSEGDIFDFPAMRRALELQAPAWPPGAQPAYNTTNFGYLVGTLVEKVTGQRIDRFLQENVCGPLGVDYHMGLAESDLDRVATLYPSETPNLQYLRGQTPGSTIGRAWNAMAKPWNADALNTPKVRTALLPSFGGHGNARGQATIYAALANGGTLNGVRLLSSEAVQNLHVLQWETDRDAILERPLRMAVGFFKNKPGWVPMGPNMNAYGFFGSGGTLAFADPERRLSFAAQSNFQCGGESVGERTEALVEAAFSRL
ncbi:serine hydrolase domain-containing protein [Martelella limonii]|uniref:serine hydrolase domain-containing protein n=1 Tax=Martelella limonii TaxID=1647649 RepID=UPI00157FF8B4|nr:serine hydrolase domain-containing protein [Martelella limonii]